MGFHKCTHPSCGFHLPAAYFLPRCPWHMAENASTKAKIAVAVSSGALLAVGWGAAKAVEIWRRSNSRKEVEAGQAQWRKAAQERRSQMDIAADPPTCDGQRLPAEDSPPRPQPASRSSNDRGE